MAVIGKTYVYIIETKGDEEFFGKNPVHSVHSTAQGAREEFAKLKNEYKTMCANWNVNYMVHINTDDKFIAIDPTYANAQIPQMVPIAQMAIIKKCIRK